MYTTGHLSDIEDNKGFFVYIPFENTGLLEKHNISEVEVRLDDGRRISNKQRRYIYALIRQISNWCGHLPEEMKEYLKFDFELESGCEYFSLSDVDMTTARQFIQYLIEFCVRHGVPFYDTHITDYVEDTAHYIYKCLEYRKCAVHGSERADIHHCIGSRVGMGRDRTQIVHLGLTCLPLCRECHTICHLDEADFLDKHHIFGVELDENLCKTLGMNFKTS